MKIEVFLDDELQPRQVLTPPERVDLDTREISDGKHTLRFVAVKNGEQISVRHINFEVQNGPTIDVHGIHEGDRVSGNVSLLTNAYGSSVGDEFEVVSIETPAPIPTWAWVVFLIVVGWGMGYLSLSLADRPDSAVAKITAIAAGNETGGTTGSGGDNSWTQMGAQVYGNNCAACHQGNGTGLAGVFPPLVNNPAVLDVDPTEHILAIINGVSGKVIEGVEYGAPMPPFGAALSDEQIAAVVNHERTSWGNSSQTVETGDVQKLR